MCAASAIRAYAVAESTRWEGVHVWRIFNDGLLVGKEKMRNFIARSWDIRFRRAVLR